MRYIWICQTWPRGQGWHYIHLQMTPQIQEIGIVPRKDHNLDKYMLNTVCFIQDAGIFNKKIARRTTGAKDFYLVQGIDAP